MGILSDFFIADAAYALNYNGGEGVADDDKCQWRSLTPLQTAQFLAVLRGVDYSVEMISEFKLLTPEEADDWTMSVPHDMVEALAAISSSEIDQVASQFAQETEEELGWSTEDFVPIVAGLATLARRAIASHKQMYLWNSL